MSMTHLGIAALALVMGSSHNAHGMASEARPTFSARFLQRVHVPTNGGDATLFGPLREIELRVTIYNDEDAGQSVMLKRGFFEQIAWRLVQANGSARDLHASWSDVVECRGPGFAMSCDLAEDIALAPTVSVEGGVTLTVADGVKGEFEFAHFTLTADLDPLRAQIVDLNGRPWNGKMESPRRFPLIIRAPANLSEQAVQYGVLGGREFNRGNFPAALVYYEQQAKAQPSNTMAHIAVAETLFSLKRFPEALAVFRRADAMTSAGGHSLVPQNIAAVLCALDRGAEAESYLRQRYPQHPEIVAQLMVLARNRAERTRHRK